MCEGHTGTKVCSWLCGLKLIESSCRPDCHMGFQTFQKYLCAVRTWKAKVFFSFKKITHDESK